MLLKCLILFVFLLFFSGAATACVVDIYANSANAPKSWKDNDSNNGILVEITRWVSEDINCELNIRLYPWKRALAFAKAGNGGIVGLSKNAERLKYFDYSDAVFHDELVLVVLQGNEFQFSGLPDLAGKKIGALRGASYGESYEQAQQEYLLNIIEDQNPGMRLKKLAKGRIDVALIGSGKSGLASTVRSDVELSNIAKKFVPLMPPFHTDPNFFGFAKSMDKRDLIQSINASIGRGVNSGAFAAILRKFE